MAGKLCQQCGVALPADSPDGICPACLFQLGLASEVPDPAATADRPGRFVAPSLSELTERFPELEIIELLGQGGMGAVYKARQKSLDRIVAVKILPTETARDPAFAERFAREARALAKLSHANIVIVYEFGERDGLYYIMMEYVDGVNLRDMIVSGELTPTEALAIVPQICEALQ